MEKRKEKKDMHGEIHMLTDSFQVAIMIYRSISMLFNMLRVPGELVSF